MDISDGARVSSRSAVIADLEISGFYYYTGVVTVNGAGSTWTNAADLVVGGAGDGSMSIGNGGRVTNTDAAMVIGPKSSATVTVTGLGSTWANSGALVVGSQGLAKLEIHDGARVSNTFAVVGQSSGGSGTVTVDGAGSSWANAQVLTIGDQGTGQLIVNSGATVSCAGGVVVVACCGEVPHQCPTSRN